MGGNHFKDLVDLLVVDHSLASTKHRKAITSSPEQGTIFNVRLDKITRSLLPVAFFFLSLNGCSKPSGVAFAQSSAEPKEPMVDRNAIFPAISHIF